MQAAAAVGVDACPMEGIDVAALDTALGLPEKGLRAVVMCALGYSSEQDFNAKLPKSRLPAEVVFSEIWRSTVARRHQPDGAPITPCNGA